MSVLPLETQLSREGIPLTSWILSHVCVYPRLDFHWYILWSFFYFNGLG